MKVIICGAGQVGFHIARYLSGGANDVTVIDQRPQLARRVIEALDLRSITGHASHPPVLEQAGAADADMIIAVTDSDETNMLICKVADALFKVPTKIARVRHQSYLDPMWAALFARENLPIDVVISPEIEVARAIGRRLQVPGASMVIPLAGDKVRLIGLRCRQNCPLVRTPLRQLTALFPDLAVVVIGIVRNGKPMVPSAEDQMLPDDEVTFIVDTKQAARVLAAFGYEEPEARRVVILGGGNVGKFLAQQIEASMPAITPTIVELDQEQATEVAKDLQRTIVLGGDALDPDILAEAGVASADAVVAVTDHDETNVLSALLAKRHGGKRVMALVNKSDYGELMSTLGIDVVISPRDITVSNILQHVRRGRIHAVHSIYEGFGEVIEADALETSGLVGRPLRDVRLPEGVLVGAVLRAGKVLIARGQTVIQTNDRVILFAAAGAVKKVEKMFSVGLEFF